jgi:hypothetical protein
LPGSRVDWQIPALGVTVKTGAPKRDISSAEVAKKGVLRKWPRRSGAAGFHPTRSFVGDPPNGWNRP